MSTLFIALQCCQCSIMQVKQKKKSSNKWNCAVCNQKQSVRRVFAQGFIAKDLRKFVQDFNMSRKSFDDGEFPLAGTLDPPLPATEHGDVNHKKKRDDWSAYLDQEDYHTFKEQQSDHDGDDFEPLVVTELQKGMFKKRRVVEDSTAGSDKLFKKPIFTNSQEEPMVDQPRVTTSLTERNPKRNNYTTQDIPRTQKSKPTSSNAASKWNDYLTEDNENQNLELGWKKSFNLEDHSGARNKSVLELEAMTCEIVEDDIHPDFM